MGRSGISRAPERAGSRPLAGQESRGTQGGVLRYGGATLRRDGNGEAVIQEKKTLTTGVHRGAQRHTGDTRGFPVHACGPPCPLWLRLLIETKWSTRRCYLYERNESLEITSWKFSQDSLSSISARRSSECSRCRASSAVRVARSSDSPAKTSARLASCMTCAKRMSPSSNFPGTFAAAVCLCRKFMPKI